MGGEFEGIGLTGLIGFKREWCLSSLGMLMFQDTYTMFVFVNDLLGHIPEVSTNGLMIHCSQRKFHILHLTFSQLCQFHQHPAFLYVPIRSIEGYLEIHDRHQLSVLQYFLQLSDYLLILRLKTYQTLSHDSILPH